MKLRSKEMRAIQVLFSFIASFFERDTPHNDEAMLETEIDSRLKFRTQMWDGKKHHEIY